jgi:hypothetical protein
MALRANPQTHKHVPERLQHYLSDPILPSGWYPEKDYNVLIGGLALGLDRRIKGSDVWSYFGRTCVQRDIAGEQGSIPARSHVKTAGVYRTFAENNPDGLAGFFQRLERIWRLYHDSGRMTVARAADDACTVVVRVLNFNFPFRGLVDVQTAFFHEYARLLGFRLEARLSRSVTDGDLCCEWLSRAEPTPENLGSLATLPVDGA